MSEISYHTNDDVLIKGRVWIHAKYSFKDDDVSSHCCKLSINGITWFTHISDDKILPYDKYAYYENTCIDKAIILDRSKYIPIALNQEVLFRTCPSDISLNSIWLKGTVKGINTDTYTITFKLTGHKSIGICKIDVPKESVFPYTDKLGEEFIESTETEKSVIDYWYKHYHQEYIVNFHTTEH